MIHPARAPEPSIELRRMVATLAVWLSLGASALILLGAAITEDLATAARIVSPLIVSGIGLYQLRTGRFNTDILLAVAAVLTFGQVALLGSGAYMQAAAVALVVIGMVWTMFLPQMRWWHLAAYSLFLVVAQVVWGWGLLPSETIASAVGSVMAFVGAAMITNWLQREIRSSERRYRNLFGASPVAIWEEDFSAVADALAQLRTSGVDNLRQYLESNPSQLDNLVRLIEVVDVNDATARLLAAESRTHLLGPLAPPTTQTARASLVEQLVAVWEGQDELEFEFTGQIQTSERRHFILRWSVSSPDLRHVIVAMTDITLRKEAERALQESRDQFERLAANAADAITRLRLSPAPEWEYVSPSVERIVGYTPDDFYADGYIMRRIAHPDDRSRLAEFMNHPETWDEALAIRLISKSGNEVWAEMRLTPIYDEAGNLAYIETITRDITERKEYQTRLEELIRSKDEFVASVSHELRTPLTAVVGLAQELRDNRKSFTPGEAVELIEMIAGQSTEVADIVDDLLVAARADIGKVSIYPEPLDLAAEVETVIAATEDPTQMKVSGSEARCLADPTRVRQVLRNLVSNALRYGGTSVEISTYVRNGAACVAVQDDGEGIPIGEVEKVFDPYHRAHRDQTQPASVGLGLTVSRQLAQLMGGDVTYRHTNGFTVFELSLPIDAPETPVTSIEAAVS